MLVPALDAGKTVWDLRLKFDPSASAGVPPHVTLMYPFLAPADLTPPVIEALEGLIGRTQAFDYSLVGLRRFEQGVIYLEPEPSAPFARLTGEVGRRFGLLPFGGEFGELPVMHLTLAMPDSSPGLAAIAEQLHTQLPIAMRAEEAWLMAGDDRGGWTTLRKMALAGLSAP